MYSYRPEDQSGHKGVISTFDELEEAKRFAMERTTQYPVFSIQNDETQEVILTEEDLENKAKSTRENLFPKDEDRQGHNY